MLNKNYLRLKDLFFVLVKRPYLISSYPKAGSTFVRFFIFNILLMRKGKSHSLSHLELNQHCPELGKGNVAHSEFNFFVKTHHDIHFYSDKRMLRIIRNPYECLCSAFEYYNRSTEINYESINVFLESKRGISSYSKHLNVCSRKKGLIIKYENLVKYPLLNFEEILNFLEISASTDELKKNLNLVSRENMIKFEEQINTEKVQNFSKKKSYDHHRATIDLNLLHKIDHLENIYKQL